MTAHLAALAGLGTALAGLAALTEIIYRRKVAAGQIREGAM